MEDDDDERRLVSTKKYFEDLGIVLTDDWLQACLDWIKSTIPQNEVSDDFKVKEEIYSQWLDLNLTELSHQILPPNLKQIKCIVLPKQYALQMNSMIDIGESAFSQYSKIRKRDTENESVSGESNTFGNWEPIGRRCLKLTLTDGVQIIHAMEIEFIPDLKTDLKPGTKILISGPVECRRGILHLRVKHVKILGGEVESLYESNNQETLLKNMLNGEHENNNESSRVTETQRSDTQFTNSQNFTPNISNIAKITPNFTQSIPKTVSNTQNSSNFPKTVTTNAQNSSNFPKTAKITQITSNVSNIPKIDSFFRPISTQSQVTQQIAPLSPPSFNNLNSEDGFDDDDDFFREIEVPANQNNSKKPQKSTPKKANGDKKSKNFIKSPPLYSVLNKTIIELSSDDDDDIFASIDEEKIKKSSSCPKSSKNSEKTNNSTLNQSNIDQNSTFFEENSINMTKISPFLINDSKNTPNPNFSSSLITQSSKIDAKNPPNSKFSSVSLDESKSKKTQSTSSPFEAKNSLNLRSKTKFLPPIKKEVRKIGVSQTPYIFISVLKNKIFSSEEEFKIKGTITTLLSELIKDKKCGEFILRANVNDGTSGLDVEISSEIIIQKCGMGCKEMKSLKKNEEGKKKIIDALARLTKFLENFNGIIHIKKMGESHYVVTKLVEVEKSDVEGVGERLGQLEKTFGQVPSIH